MISVRHLVLVIASTLACGSALAQWQWVDATGRKVYSDTAPPQGVPDKNILKRPGAAASVARPAEPAAVASPAPAVKPAAADPKLEAKRKEAEQAEAAKRRAETDKMMAARSDNCARAKSAKATIQSGVRIQTVNAKGEREFLDDAARAAESKRLDGIVASDCGPLPTKTAGDASAGNKAVP